MDLPERFPWPGDRPAAVSLAYLGASPEALVEAVPLLSALHLPGTFFLSATDLLENPYEWRRAIEHGHELANGSLVGMSIDGELPNWTCEMVRDDLRLTEELFRDMVPGAATRTVAAPGRSTLCANGDYSAELQALFPAVLTGREEENHPVFVDPRSLARTTVDSAPRAVQLLDTIRERGTWAVLCFDLGTPAGRMVHSEVLRAALPLFGDLHVDTVGANAEVVAAFRRRLTARS